MTTWSTTGHSRLDRLTEGRYLDEGTDLSPLGQLRVARPSDAVKIGKELVQGHKDLTKYLMQVEQHEIPAKAAKLKTAYQKLRVLAREQGMDVSVVVPGLHAVYTALDAPGRIPLRDLRDKLASAEVYNENVILQSPVSHPSLGQH